MSNPLNPYFRTKPIDTILEESKEKKGGLKRALGPVDLVAIGVGAMIGAGIFVLTGTAAKTVAGPAIMLSYVFAGFACILAALCYAEFASRFPISGSAYTYAYAGVGELFAWIIGWDLVLEYTIGASAVAVAWAEYLDELVPLPAALTQFSLFGHEVNMMAILLITALSTLLAIGIKESARVNAVIVAVKVGVVLFVIGAGLFFFNIGNWEPLTPFAGLVASEDGGEMVRAMCPVGSFCWDGIFAGAALVFFSYIGFDAVSATAEEVENPQRNMPIGIIGSLLLCTVLYIAVSGVITGMVPYDEIDQGAPLAAAFSSVGLTWAKNLIAIGGVAGLTTVVLILLLSQPRIYFSMARDGLFFKWFANVHEKFRTPFNATIATGILAAVIAAFVPLEDLHHMVSIGTLFAFAMVCASVLITRYRTEDNPGRSTTLVLIMGFGVLMTSALFTNIQLVQMLTFVIFSALLVVPVAIPLLNVFADIYCRNWESLVKSLIKLAITAIILVNVVMFGSLVLTATIENTQNWNWVRIFQVLFGSVALIPALILCSEPQSNVPTKTFKCPWVPVVPIVGMVSMMVMMAQLKVAAWERLGWWMAGGLLIYALYGLWNSKLRKAA